MIPLQQHTHTSMSASMHACAWMAIIGTAGTALANQPHMGGQMEHILVSVFNNQLFATIENPGDMPLTLQNYGERYNSAASVLDRSGYNAQYGWLANGFFDLPPDANVWIEQTSQTQGLRTYQALTYDPIFGTDNAPNLWQWDGAMTHNWYAAYAVGDYQANYNIFVGTLDGEPYPGYTGAQVHLSWTYPSGGLDSSADFGSVSTKGFSQIPAPGTLMLLFGTYAGMSARRRR